MKVRFSLYFFAAFFVFACKPAGDNIEISTITARYGFDSQNGALTYVIGRSDTLISSANSIRNLFSICFRDSSGNKVNFTSGQASRFSYKISEQNHGKMLRLSYQFHDSLEVEATVSFTDSLSQWTLSIDNNTSLQLDHYDYPLVYVPDNLTGNGGRGYLFRPSMEGCLITNLHQRDSCWQRAVQLEYPSTGWIGIYPGSCTMPYFAYYTDRKGLYFGTHDPEDNLKGLEYYGQPDGTIQLLIRTWPGTISKLYESSYPVVLQLFKGDWYEAADIYREWFQENVGKNWKKLADRDDLPEWFKKSPVFVTYPVRGTVDVGKMNPNEYFPYIKAMPVIASLQSEFNSPVLDLLMHWEGSAPWAPPYVWPPYGGEEQLNTFRDELHKTGNFIGLYTSGTGYTLRSNTDSTYDMTEVFKKEDLEKYMTIQPNGKLCENGICCGPWAQRSGYDMCPVNKWVKETVLNEIIKIASNDIDYVQFFDQNLGGNCFFCYSKDHGHPPVPGKWQQESMISLINDANDRVKGLKKSMIIGCEGAAAQPLIPYLGMNDLRYTFNYMQGLPVPAYAFIYHEYINNFMGNQVGIDGGIDISKTPDNLLYRIAYSFSNGDLITLVLAEKGLINWGWGYPWYKTKPDQNSVKSLVKNLNGWRTGNAEPFLVYGRMMKPYEIKCNTGMTLTHPRKFQYPLPAVIGTRWISQDKREVQFFINYTSVKQSFSFADKRSVSNKIKKFSSPGSTEFQILTDNNTYEVPPFGAIMLEFDYHDTQ